MSYTTNLIKTEWYEPLYNEVIKVCDYMLNYTTRYSETENFLKGEDLDIGNNTTVFIGVWTKDLNKHYVHIGVHSTYPNILRYIILQTMKNGKIEYIIDKNPILHNGILYGQYWYEDWKSSKSPMWVDLHTLRKYIEYELIDHYGSSYVFNMNLEEYVRLETNKLLLLPQEKKYNSLYDEMTPLFNIRNTSYEKYHPMSYPLSDM